MAQIFSRHANDMVHLSLVALLLVLGGLGYLVFGLSRSALITDVGVTQHQPIPFSHRHHVGELGIDCRYCHTSVKESSFAGLPPTATCMSCHSQIWLNSPMLE